MKNIILILIVALLSCAKTEDEIVITNTYPKAVSLILNGQKKYEVLQPSESVSYFVSGLNNVKFVKDNEVLLEGDVMVEGLTYFP